MTEQQISLVTLTFAVTFAVVTDTATVVSTRRLNRRRQVRRIRQRLSVSASPRARVFDSREAE